MRFTRQSSPSLDELRRGVLEEIEALSPGLRSVGSDIPVAGLPSIDTLACDGRGRLALVCIQIAGDVAFVGTALERWSWAVANAGLLRTLAPNAAIDKAAPARLILVATQWTDGARLVAGAISSPEFEAFEAALLWDGARSGLLLEPLKRPDSLAADRAPGAGSLLAALPPGPARSIARRILEELRGSRLAGEAVVAEAAIDIRSRSRSIASFLSTDSGLEMRPCAGPGRLVTTDEDCREAVRSLLREESTERARGVESGAPTSGGQAVPLTAEEIAEFEMLETASRVSRAPASPPPTAVPAPSGWLEN